MKTLKKVLSSVFSISMMVAPITAGIHACDDPEAAAPSAAAPSCTDDLQPTKDLAKYRNGPIVYKVTVQEFNGNISITIGYYNPDGDRLYENLLLDSYKGGKPLAKIIDELILEDHDFTTPDRRVDLTFYHNWVNNYKYVGSSGLSVGKEKLTKHVARFFHNQGFGVHYASSVGFPLGNEYWTIYVEKK